MNEVAKIEPQELASQEPGAQVISPTMNTMQMVAHAVQSNATVETLEKLMALHERFEANQNRRAFDFAMSQAKAKITPIVKKQTVDYGKGEKRTHYQYENLADIDAQVDPILAEFGLSCRYRSEDNGQAVKITCIIAHQQGHFEETALSGPADTSGSKNPYQAKGSAVTYLQRYTKKIALGLSATKDDDAQSANADNEKPREQQKPQGPNHRAIVDDIITSIRSHGAPAVEADPKFTPAMNAMKAAAPELAAQVEVELETWRKANQPAASSLIDGSEIPY